MKKVLLALIAVVLLLALATPAFATAGIAEWNTATEMQAAPGDTLSFQITITNADTARAIRFIPEFDETIFALDSLKIYPPYPEAANEAGDLVSWSEPMDINNLTVKFSLKVSDTAPKGKSYNVTCKYEVTNAAGEQETGTTSAVKVTIPCVHQFNKKVEKAEYLCSEATCTQKATYYYSCECGAKINTTFEGGALKEHKYKEVIADEYVKTAANCKTMGEYYLSCEVCKAKSDATFFTGKLGDHVYDFDCDADCNICTATREATHQTEATWQTNAEKHWKICSICNQPVEEAAHTPGAEATETTAQTCTVCEKILVPAGNHVHKYPDEWKNDDAKHWHECECGAEDKKAAHSWGEAIVIQEATAEAEGIRRSVCLVCELTKDEPIAKLPAQQENPEETNPITEELAPIEPNADPEPQEKKGSKVLVVILVIFLVLSLAGNIVLVILLKKKIDENARKEILGDEPLPAKEEEPKSESFGMDVFGP